MKNWECYDHALSVDMSGADAPHRIAEAARATGVKFDGVFATHDHQQALTGQVCLRWVVSMVVSMIIAEQKDRNL